MYNHIHMYFVSNTLLLRPARSATARIKNGKHIKTKAFLNKETR